MKTTSLQNPKAGLRSRTEQSGTAQRPQIDFNRRFANRSLNTERLLWMLRNEAPRFFYLAEVVGRWVWIQFETKQPSDVTRVLAELGFHWNRNRQAWQHPCGVWRTKAAKDNPRARFRSYFPADNSRA
jgi:hypothetical protein